MAFPSVNQHDALVSFHELCDLEDDAIVGK